MGILSIQSQVVSGHVGNSAAVFALQRRGHKVWPLPTTLLSHHPGHGGAKGSPLPPGLLANLLNGLVTRGCFTRCEAIISGYLGQAETAGIIIDALNRARAVGNTVYLCDPVLGDDGRSYVHLNVITEMHNLAALADIMTPNAYELEILSGQGFTTRAEALAALRRLQSKGPGIVILTSFTGSDTSANTLDVMAVDGKAAWRLSLPRLVQKFSGAGDVFAAVFLSFFLAGHETAAALGQACSILHGILAITAAQGADELQLIPAQGLLEAPARHFMAERIA